MMYIKEHLSDVLVNNDIYRTFRRVCPLGTE